MEQYFQYAENTSEEVPLYLFERNFAEAVPGLEDDYHVPVYFSPSASHGTDLFRHLGHERRPDYRWLIAGPARSGSIFHIDPNQVQYSAGKGALLQFGQAYATTRENARFKMSCVNSVLINLKACVKILLESTYYFTAYWFDFRRTRGMLQ